MARTVKAEEYSARRNEILEVAQRLVFAQGYRQTAIQDILDELQISKGAFYHYFGSKHALLEALIERMRVEAEQILVPIVQDPHLRSLEKLERCFSKLARWKTARKDYVLALLQAWYADDNAIVRQKVQAGTTQWFAPMLVQIIHQGIREGVLATPCPDQMGGVILSLLLGFSDAVVTLLLSYDPNDDDLRHIEGTVAAYNVAIERVLGAANGSVQLADVETLREWFVSPSSNT